MSSYSSKYRENIDIMAEWQFKDIKEHAPSTEINAEVKEQVNLSEQPAQVPQEPVEVVPSLEEKARKSGWRPKEEWNGDPDEWVDSGEFVRRGAYFRKHQEQAQEINQLKQITQQLTQNVLTAEKRSYEKALADIEAQKRAALEMNDVKAYDQALRAQQDTQQKYQAQQQPKQGNAQFYSSQEWSSFKSEFPWVELNDPQSRAKVGYAAALSMEFYKNNPGADEYQEVKYLAENLRQQFGTSSAQYSQSEPQKPITAQPANSRAKPSSTSSEVNFNDLGPGERMVAEYLKNSGQDYKGYVKALHKANSNSNIK